MEVVPTKAVPNQTLSVQLSGQNVQLNIYQKSFGLFMDVLVDSTLIIGGVKCENLNRIVRSVYLGFVGDFVWRDSQGKNDPYYTGFGSGGRYALLYISQADLQSVGLAA